MITIKHVDALSTRVRKQAKGLGQKLLRLSRKFATARAIHDGYICAAAKAGERVSVSVIDIPGQFLTFGPSAPTSVGLFGKYTVPTRGLFDPRSAATLPAVEAIPVVDPLGVVLSLGLPLPAGRTFVMEANVAAFDGGLVLPFVLADAAIATAGNVVTWQNVPLSNRLWLVFRVKRAGISGAVRSVSLSDDLVRTLAPGYDLVLRDWEASGILFSSPVPACAVFEDKLYFAVPVTQRRAGATPNHGIGAVLLGCVRYEVIDGAQVAALDWSHVVACEDLGETALTPAEFPFVEGDGWLAAGMDHLALLPRRLNEDDVEVLITARARVQRPTTDTVTLLPIRRRCTGQVSLTVLNGGAPSIAVDRLDALCGADSPLLAEVPGYDAGLIYVMQSPDTLIPVAGGVIRHRRAQVGVRPALDEDVDTDGLLLAEQVTEFVTDSPAGSVVQTADVLGYSATSNASGSQYPQLAQGAIGSVQGFDPELRDGAAAVFLTKYEQSEVAIGTLTAAGIGSADDLPFVSASLQVSVYQREVLDQDDVLICPWGALVTSLQDGVAKAALAKGSFASLAFVDVPLYARQGTFYTSNPVAVLEYGALYAVEVLP